MRKLKLIPIICILCLLIINVSASDILKPAKLNKDYIVLQTCATCNFVFVTISNVDGITVANQPMTNNGSGVWTYNLTPTLASRHDVNGLGDLDGVNTSFVTFFEVTPSGKVSSTGDSILYSLFSIILFGIIATISFFVFTMPSRNERNERNEETKIIKIKYIRMIFIALIWPLTILLLNFLNTLALNFSALSQFSGIISFFFDIMLRLSWPFTIIIIAWIIVMVIHDNNLSKRLKEFENMRFLQ